MEDTMLLTEAVEALCIATRANNRSVRTVSSYRNKLKPLVARLGNVSVETVTVHDLRAYVAEMMDSDLSPFTVSGRVRHMKRLFNWLEEEGIIENNPVERIKTPQPKRDKPKGISEEDILLLLEEARDDRLYDLRDRAIILFLADTGCRVGGLCNLRVQDLDLEAGMATVTEKGGKSRYVMFTEPTRKALEVWLDARPQDQGDDVFLGLRGRSKGALRPNGVAQMLRRRAKRAGCEGPTNPHSFRHAFARHYLLDGGDLGTLSDLLGHESVEITKKWYGVFLVEELKGKHYEHSPVRAMFGGEEK
jgi:site-specific recombinase XerD